MSGNSGHAVRQGTTVSISTQTVTPMELYMIVKDAELLRRLLQTKGISARSLSTSIGWSSHSYANRILSGQVRTVTPEAAMKIAYILQVPVDLIFTPRVSGNAEHDVRKSA